MKTKDAVLAAPPATRPVVPMTDAGLGAAGIGAMGFIKRKIFSITPTPNPHSPPTRSTRPPTQPNAPFAKRGKSGDAAWDLPSKANKARSVAHLPEYLPTPCRQLAREPSAKHSEHVLLVGVRNEFPQYEQREG